MASVKSLLVVTFLLCTLFCTNPLKADGWFYFDPIELEAEIRFDGFRTHLERASSNVSEKRSSWLLEERLFFGLSGYAIDPRISNFLLQVEPVFRQGRETIDKANDGTSGNDLDYNINLGFLQGSEGQFDANLSTFRITSANDIAFGSRNKTDISAHEILINWKNPWFPLLFGYKAGSYLQEFNRLDGLTNLRDEDRDRIRLTGRSSKLNLILDREIVDDKVFDRDYTINRALIDHNLQWGHNSRLFSSVRAFDRQGFNAYRQLNWDERLRINHTDNLTSHTSYHYFSQQAFADTTTHEGIFQLEHSLYENLESDIRLRGRSENSDTLDRHEYEIGGNSNYQKMFDFGLISIGLYGDYRWTDRVSEAGTGETINEKHLASFIDPIILEERLINNSRIIVTAEDGFVYTERVDYEVIRFGGVFTEIRIRPSGRITDEELLLISYLYEILPSARYTTLSTGFSFSYSYRWIRLFHNGYRYNNDLTSGFGAPPDQKQRTTGLELSWNFFNVVARFRAESRYRKHGGFESRETVMNETLGYSLSNLLSINFSGNQVFTKSKGTVSLDPLRSFESQQNNIFADFYAFDASLTWFARPNLTVIPSVGVWRRKEHNRSEFNRDVNRLYYNAELRVSWLVRKLTVDFYYNHNASDIDGTDQAGDRLFFSVRRVFR